MSVRSNLWYESFTDSRHLESIIFHGLNYSTADGVKKCVLRFIWSTIVAILMFYRLIGSLIHWDEEDSDAIYGNFWKGLQVPRVHIPTFFLGIEAVVLVMRVTVIIKVLSKDRFLQQTMEPIAVIAKLTGETPPGINRKVIVSLQSSLRPSILVARLSVWSSIPTTCTMSLIGHVLNNTTGWKWIPALFWTGHFVAFGIESGSTIFSSMIFVATICKLIVMSIKDTLDRKLSPSGSCGHVDTVESFTRQLTQMKQIVDFIRRLNPTIRVIFGLDTLIIIFGIVMCSFMLIMVDMNMLVTVVVAIWLSLLSVSFVDIMSSPASVHEHVTNGTKKLEKSADQISWPAKRKLQNNRVMDGLRFLSSFSCFNFIPVIDYRLTIEVSNNNISCRKC